jgi:hypothetical protein
MAVQRLILTGVGAFVGLGAMAGAAQAQTAYDRDHNVSVQERAAEEQAPLGIGLGGFLLFPQIDLGVEMNDNIFAAQVNETDDTIFHAGASARLASQWSRHALNFFGGVSSRTFSDNGDDDAVDWRLGADGRLDVVRETSIRGNAGFGHTTESRFSGNGPAALAEPIEFDYTDVGAELVHDVNRIRASIGFSYGTFDYEDGRLVGSPTPFDQDFRDNDALNVTGRVDYALSPDTAVFGSVSRLTRDYDLEGGPAFDRDSQGWRYLVGANFDLTSVVRGEIGLGYSDTEYDGTSFSNVDGLAASAEVDWFVTQITTLNFSAGRETTDSGITGAAGIDRVSYGARVDHELRRDLILTGGAALEQDDYQSIDRDDDRSRFDVGVDWYANRAMKLGASYERFEQDSAGINRDRDYTANVFMLKASFRR